MHLPVPLPTPSGPVMLDGSATLMPPTVSLTGGQVHLSVRVVVEAQLSSPLTVPADVLVEIGSQGAASLVVNVANDRLQVGIDPQSVSVSGLTLRVLGGSLPSLYGEALQLPQVASAIQAAVRRLPPAMLRTTVAGFPLTAHIAPRQMPCGASLFELPEMFHATFSVSRVVPVVTEKVLVIGVDIADVTNGDPAALRSLFGERRPVWVHTADRDGPADIRLRSFTGGGNLAISLSPQALDGILRGPISSATHDAFVNCHVALDHLSVRGDTFSPPLMPQIRIDGLRFEISANFFLSPGRDAQSRLVPGGIGLAASASLPLGVHLQTFDGPTDFVAGRQDHWVLEAQRPDVELPWWMNLGILFIGLSLPIGWLPTVALFAGVVPGALDMISGMVERSARSGISGATSSLGLGALSREITVPELEAVPARLEGTSYAFDGEGIDVYTSLSLATAPDGRPDRNLTLTLNGTQVRDGSISRHGFARFAERFTFTVATKPAVVDPVDRHVRIRWEVRRTDTNAIIALRDQARYSLVTSVGAGNPDPRRIVIDRTDPAIAASPGFKVSVRVYRPLQGRTKEIGSATMRIEIEDRLDRSHPYVWWPGWAVGSYKESVLHRTAAPGRCLMVERAPNDVAFQYVDNLPFPLADLHRHRGGTEAERRRDIVCDYCFFGGPDKTVLLI